MTKSGEEEDGGLSGAMPRRFSNFGGSGGNTLTASASDRQRRYYRYDLPGHLRWTSLVGVCLMALLAGPLFINWKPIGDMFERTGAFKHLCTEGMSASACMQLRRGRIDAIGSKAASTLFCVDLIAGLILDSLGSKAVTCIGLLVQAAGWFAVAFPGEASRGIEPGVLLWAAGGDATLFGTLSVANLFPGWQSTVLGVLGSARSLSFANGIILDTLTSRVLSLKAASLGMVGVLCCCLLFTLLYIPYVPYPKLDRLDPTRELSSTIDDNDDAEEEDADHHRMEDHRGGSSGVVVESYASAVKRRPRFNCSRFVSAVVEQCQGFVASALNLEFALFCVLPICVFIRLAYYLGTAEFHLPNSGVFYKSINPLSFLPCLLLGVFADRISAAIAIAVLGACACLSMLFVMFSGVVFESISIVLNWVFLSFLSSQFYVFAALCYPQEQMGKLVGFALFVGAVVSFVTGPMLSFAVVSRSNLLTMDALVMILCGLYMAFAVVLYFRQERPLRRSAALISPMPSKEVTAQRITSMVQVTSDAAATDEPFSRGTSV